MQCVVPRNLLRSWLCCFGGRRLLECQVTGMEGPRIRGALLAGPLGLTGSLGCMRSSCCWGQPPSPLLRQPAVAHMTRGSPRGAGRLGGLLGPPLAGGCGCVPARCPIDPVLAAHAATKHVQRLRP